MSSNNNLRYASLSKRLPDSPGAALKGTPDWYSPVPTWALHALRRSEAVPGSLFPLPGRWQQVCPICGAAVFLAFPLYMTPALEAVGPHVISHPCRFWDEAIAWNWEEPAMHVKPNINLRDYL